VRGAALGKSPLRTRTWKPELVNGLLSVMFDAVRLWLWFGRRCLREPASAVGWTRSSTPARLRRLAWGWSAGVRCRFRKSSSSGLVAPCLPVGACGIARSPLPASV